MKLENWEQKQRNFEAFWEKDYYERCNMSIRIENEALKGKRYNDVPLKQRFMDPDFLANKWKFMADNTQFFADAIPCYSIDFGTAAHATYFGCEPQFGEDTIWFEPIMKEDDIKLLQYTDAGRKVFLEHLDIVKQLVSKAKHDVFIPMTDNCGIVDALGHLRGNENLLMDMIDNPEFVKESIAKITAVWKETQVSFFEAVKAGNLGGTAHSWMQLWCPKRHAQIQCDFSVMISPDMYEEFVLPELIETSSFLDYTTYHLDGQEQIRHLDYILSVDTIDNIQWTPVAGQPTAANFIEVFKRIQKSGKGLILTPPANEVEFIVDNLSHKGLRLNILDVTSEEQAKYLIEYAKKASRNILNK
ncbi:MAG: hypothetical protein R3Y24_08055 [Eubacteriales bacterium]